jgi:hypothetical protein
MEGLSMRMKVMIAAVLAVLMSGPVAADGVCCPMPKKPLRAEGLHHLKRPLLACNQNLCHIKRPLVVLA